MAPMRSFRLQVILALVFSCCGCFVACEGMPTDKLEEQAAGPCAPVGPRKLAGTQVGNIKLSSGQITLPECDGLDRIGLVLFHNGFGVRCNCFRKTAQNMSGAPRDINTIYTM